MVLSAFARLWDRRGRVALGLSIVGVSVALLAVYPGYVEAQPPAQDQLSQQGNLQVESEITKLTTCYSLATDAIGRGDLEAGKERYKDCFTDDAVLSVYLPGQDPDGPPFYSTVGTDTWADFVKETFDGAGYIVTQHLIGTINIEIKNGQKASMTSYLNATHVRPNGTINIANGTYVDKVVRDHGSWKISRRTLTIISLVDAGTPAP